MWDRIRERVGSAGLVVAVIALVLAVAGGAYAAGGGLSGKQKKEVEKISKKFAGKPGAPGTAGANGKDGASGSNGTNGANGNPGANGESITARVALPTECEERGGTIVEDEAQPPSEIEVCNGETGAEGSPWTAGGTLPGPPAGEEEEGASETGSWAFTQDLAAGTVFYVPISFAIPLAGLLNATQVHWQDEANFEDFDGPGANEEVGCKGAFGLPLAPGHSLCVYKGPGTVQNAVFLGIKQLGGENSGANRPGAVLKFEVEAAGIAEGTGAFAVTGF